MTLDVYRGRKTTIQQYNNLELWWLHMKAEEKIDAFMFFSVVMQFVYSLEKKTELGDGGGGGEGQQQRDRRAKF